MSHKFTENSDEPGCYDDAYIKWVESIDPSMVDKVRKDERYPVELADIMPEEWQRISAYYMALVSHVDDCVGKILEALKQTGREEDTIVIYDGTVTVKQRKWYEAFACS